MSKSDKIRVPEYLRHILEAIQRIDRYTEDMTEAGFLENEMVQDAVIRNIEIMVKPRTTSASIKRNLPRSIPKFPGRTSIGCATALPMATSRWIWRLSGKPYATICQSWLNKCAHCLVTIYDSRAVAKKQHIFARRSKKRAFS